MDARKKRSKDINVEMKVKDDESFKMLLDAATSAEELAVRRVLMDRKIDINFKLNDWFYDAETVVMKMAEAGRHAAVELLINTFNANLNEAVVGYARARNTEKVEAYLLKHNVMKNAMRGYAFAGDEALVNNLLDRGASLCDAAYGYARGGHHAALQSLFRRYDLKDGAVAFAVEGSAHSGLTDLAEALILEGAAVSKPHSSDTGLIKKLTSRKFDPVYNLSHVAMGGFAAAGYFVDQNKCLKLLACIKNDVIFKHFADFLKADRSVSHLRFQDMTDAEMVQKATLLRQAILEKNMSYDQALTSGVANAKSEPKFKLFSLQRSSRVAEEKAEALESAEETAPPPILLVAREEEKVESPRKSM